MTDVQRGYKLFQANCSRCHGAQGEGGIGPVLNDQAKLLTHLTPQYLATVLTVGGRYVCGDPNSLMLAWLEPKGPLNYRQVEELIAFIRAPSTLTYTAVDPATGAETETTGWRDASYVDARRRDAGPELLEGRLRAPPRRRPAAPLRRPRRSVRPLQRRARRHRHPDS